eukprot:GFUD01014021.1.p1 GENE.GFUD01014021.1~~GFUD01014021.1.p1  ORF type:complete len:502 (+),score=117.10 GFUD01014021.1:107-1612(+)
MEGNSQVIKNAKLTGNIFSTNQNLEPGDIVLQLPPDVAGPGRGKQPVCLGCLHLAGKDKAGKDKELLPCSSCSWPVCSAECEKSELHEKECALLKSSNFKNKITNFEEATTDLDFVTPLRLLTKLSSDKKLKEKFAKIQANYSDVKQRNIEEYDPTSDERIIKVIKNDIKCGFDIKEIEEAIAIIEKLTIPLENGAQAIYQDLPNIAHSCSPNTYYNTLTSKGIVFRATAPIKSGTIVTYCKTDMAKCNLFRRRQLQKLFISCECDRCKDGSEFGTGFGSLQCKDCDGLVSSTDPRNGEAEWLCGGCKKTRTGKECIAILDDLHTKLEKLSESADDNKESVLSFEKLLSREGEWKQLPVNSQLFLDMRYRLMFIYQYHKDFYRTDDVCLKSKMDHCDEWFKLTESLFPGRSYSRVLIEFEKVNAAVGLMNWMQATWKPTAEVNLFIGEINKMGMDPVNMLKDEEEQSLNNMVKQTLMVAVESREAQKTRVLINQWADEDEV